MRSYCLSAEYKEKAPTEYQTGGCNRAYNMRPRPVRVRYAGRGANNMSQRFCINSVLFFLDRFIFWSVGPEHRLVTSQLYMVISVPGLSKAKSEYELWVQALVRVVQKDDNIKQSVQLWSIHIYAK